MNIFKFIIPISALWLISEIALAIAKRGHADDTAALDKHSLRILWVTIIISVSVGVTLGVKGVGLMHLGGYWVVLLGLLLIVAGLAIRWVAILTLGKFFTVDINVANDHRIIDQGIYKYVRHPAYSGSLFSFLGLGLSFSNWLSVLIIIIPITAAFIYRISLEEKALKQALGDEYINYAKATKRLIPGIY